MAHCCYYGSLTQLKCCSAGAIIYMRCAREERVSNIQINRPCQCCISVCKKCVHTPFLEWPMEMVEMRALGVRENKIQC